MDFGLMPKHMSPELLKEFLDAFNRHDRGVDLLEFVDGKITRKDSFWKIVE